MLFMSESNQVDRSTYLRLGLGARQNVSGIRAKLRPVMFHVAMWNYPMVLGTVVVFAQTGNFYMAARHAVALVYNLAFFAVIVGLLGWLPDRARRIGTLLVYAFLAIFTVISAVHFILYGELMGLPSLYAALDTTMAEGSEYLSTIIRPVHISIAALAALPLCIAAAQGPGLPGWPRPRPSLRWAGILGTTAGLGAFSAFGFVRPYIYENNPVLLVFSAGYQAYEEKGLMKEMYDAFPPSLANNVSVLDNKPAVHILIIGESLTRRHMSLYGYARNTTPELSQLAPTLDIATDACSSRATTTPQLKELLTFATREDSSAFHKGPHLVQIAQAGGFRTSWLSNQQVVGTYDRWAAVFARPAEARTFVNLRGSGDGVSVDGRLLPLLKQAIGDGTGRKFIVLHLLGSHHAYDLRYPMSYRRFTDRNGMPPSFLAKNPNPWRVDSFNSYDNSVLYNDHVVAEVFREASKLERSTVTYISDHGEALMETSGFWGHFDGPGPRQMYEIPLMFYISPDIRRDLGSSYTALKANLGKPIQSDQMMNTLLGLYGLSYPLVRPEQSLLNAAFRPKTRFCDQLAP
jgi:heptose-I-phosphate ethanolaminephosphotransferase